MAWLFLYKWGNTMKKMKYFLLLLIPIFFMVLSGCSSLSIKTTSNSYSADGLVAVVKGKATKATSLTYTIDGTTKKVTMNNGQFAFSVPVSTKNRDVKIVAKNGSDSQTKLVTINKATAIGDYTVFAQKYNYQALLSGQPTDQLPLVVESDLFAYTRPDKTQLHFNVQEDFLMGISMESSFKSMKTKSGKESFGRNLAMIAQFTGADPKAVMKDLSKQMKDLNSGNKTTIKQISSNGIKFNINLASNGFYVYVTK